MNKTQIIISYLNLLKVQVQVHNKIAKKYIQILNKNDNTAAEY